MKNWKYIIFAFLLAIVTHAQTTVSGTVTDDAGTPIPFAEIYFEDYSEGTESNENGNFYYESQQTKDTLIVSFTGYEEFKLPLKQKRSEERRVGKKCRASR